MQSWEWGWLAEESFSSSRSLKSPVGGWTPTSETNVYTRGWNSNQLIGKEIDLHTSRSISAWCPSSEILRLCLPAMQNVLICFIACIIREYNKMWSNLQSLQMNINTTHVRWNNQKIKDMSMKLQIWFSFFMLCKNDELILKKKTNAVGLLRN